MRVPRRFSLDSTIDKRFSIRDKPLEYGCLHSLPSDGLERLELKQRVEHVIAALAECLPTEYESAVDILVKASQKWDSGNPVDPLNGFAVWPSIDFIGEYGLHRLNRFDAQ